MAATTSDLANLLNEGDADESAAVQSAVVIYPPTDFNSMNSWYDQNLGIVPEVDHRDKDSPESRLINCAIKRRKCARLAQRAGPSNYVNPADPDIWFIHGDSDPVVPLGQSELMFQMYARNTGGNGFTAFTTVKGAGHSLDEVIGKKVANFTTQLTDRRGNVGLAKHMRPTWNNIARFFVSSFKRL